MYVDDATWRDERDAVLHGEWFCVGRLDDLGLAEPSRVAVVDVAGESVLVTSDEDGVLHASYNVCRHRGSQLRPVEGEPDPAPRACAASALRCPYHSWTYGLDGRLLRAPHADEVARPGAVRAGTRSRSTPGAASCSSTSRPRAPVRWPTRSRAPAASLANYALGDLVTGAALTYDVAANYKVVLENYNECYHCGPVHPELCRLVPASPAAAPTSTGRTASRTARAPGPSP